MRTGSSIVIENPERYSRIFTVVQGWGSVNPFPSPPGAVLLAITHEEYADGQQSPRTSYRSHEGGDVCISPGTPAVAASRVVLVFGYLREEGELAAAYAVLEAENRKSVEDAVARVKAAEEIAKKRDEQLASCQKQLAAAAEARDGHWKSMLEAQERMRTLEADLAKVKRAFGEKSYAEAVAAS